MENLGIENLKEALKTAVEFGESIENAMEDDKITIKEAITIVWDARGIPKILKHAGDIKAELKDLDEDERAELSQYIKDELDLDNDKLETKIEWGVDLLLLISRLFKN